MKTELKNLIESYCHKVPRIFELVDKIDALYNPKLLPIEERQKIFQDELREFVDQYGSKMMNDFYKYWGCYSGSQRKLPFEKEKSWNLKARLANWKRMGDKRKIINILNTKVSER